MAPLFDVMLPYYGDVDQLKSAVGSVLGQTHDDWRLIVIDDGYPDPEPARWFAEMADPRVVYERNASNIGLNANFRKAVDLVTAEWFVMMGGDDVMHPDYLAAMAASVRPGLAMIQPRVDVIDEDGAPFRPLGDRVKQALSFRVRDGVRVVDGERLAASLLQGNWAYFPSVTWHSATVQRFNFREGYNVVLDLALMLDLIAEGGRMALIPDVIFSYRRHSRSLSSVHALDGRRFEEERRFFREQAVRFAELGWTRAARAANLHLASRLNALSLLPRAASRGGVPGALLRHAFR